MSRPAGWRRQKGQANGSNGRIRFSWGSPPIYRGMPKPPSPLLPGGCAKRSEFLFWERKIEMNTQYLTCQFKIHNPSARKRQVMDYALEQYTLGYTELLEYAHDNLSVLEREGIYEKTGKYTGMSIAPCLPRSSHKIHSSAKDSLRQNVAANLASYFELIKKDESPSLPTSRDPSPEADLEALDYFILVGSDLEDYKESKRRYLKRSKSSVMPIFFCRSDGAAQNKSGDARNRNFSLLINSRRDKLFAVMWLLPAGHELCKSIGINSQDGNHLIKLDTGEIFSSNSSTAILIPLELGRNGWQYEKFIEASINGKARPKTAFLLKMRKIIIFM